MAKAFPPFPVSGTVGGFTFFRRGDETFVRERIFIPKKKKYAKQDPSQRDNRQTFGGASKAAAHIYKSLRGKQRGQLLPYSHNFIATKLKRYAERTQRAVDKFTFRAAHGALQGLDLSRKDSPTKFISIVPIGPHHSPEKIQIQGLDQAAKAIHIHGNAHLELRFQIRYIEYNEMNCDPETHKWKARKDFHKTITYSTPFTQWIPTEILPAEGFTIDLKPPTAHFNATPANLAPLLVFVKVEWREVREVGETIKPLPEMAIVRLAAMQYPEAMAEEIAKVRAQFKVEPPAPEPYLLDDARANPEAFLKEALHKLHAPPG